MTLVPNAPRHHVQKLDVGVLVRRTRISRVGFDDGEHVAVTRAEDVGACVAVFTPRHPRDFGPGTNVPSLERRNRHRNLLPSPATILPVARLTCQWKDRG